MKKYLALALAAVLTLGALSGCGSSSAENEGTEENSTQQEQEEESTQLSGAISVISREEGSGTRGAFVELMGIEEEDADGNTMDMTTQMAEITSSTAVMMTTVAGNTAAIGYISLGSLDDSVKAVTVDGAEASVDAIKDGSYKVSRPFNIATMGDVSDAAADFIAFIMSDEGQAVVEENGYISNGSTGAFAGTNPTGSVTVAGSSSVSPVMEKLKEAYEAVNPNVTIEIQTNDSTTGMTSTMEGICEIGMASRELKDSELEAGLTPQVIALDGIAVIVNNENPISDLTSTQIKDIFSGNVTDWSEVQ